MFVDDGEIKCSNYRSSEFIFPDQLKKYDWQTTADILEMSSTAPSLTFPKHLARYRHIRQ